MPPGKSKPNKNIATKDEVLEFLTGVMRRDIEENIKLSDAMSAADKLYKYIMQEQAEEKGNHLTGIVYLPQISENEERI